MFIFAKKALPVLNVPDASAVTFTVGIVKRLRLLIRKIKASPNYNESIGRDLGRHCAQNAQTDAQS